MSRFTALVLGSVLATGALQAEEVDSPVVDTPADAPAYDLADYDLSNPAGTLEALSGALAADDMSAVFELLVKPDEAAAAQTEWDATRAQPATPDMIQIDQVLQMLLAEGGEDIAYMMLQPQLQQIQQFVPMAPMMLGGMIGQLQQDNPDMSAEDVAQAQQVIAAAGAWLAGLNLADEATARAGIAVVIESLRSNGIESVASLTALELPDMLDKIAPLLGATKEVLALYDLDVQGLISSVSFGEAEIAEQAVERSIADLAAGDAEAGPETETVAAVPMTVTLFGADIDTTAELVQVGDRWYIKADEPADEAPANIGPGPALDGGSIPMGVPMPPGAPALDGPMP